jgi:hypothetical protein
MLTEIPQPKMSILNSTVAYLLTHDAMAALIIA